MASVITYLWRQSPNNSFVVLLPSSFLIALSAKIGVPGKVSSIEYDPNRSAYIMLVTYRDGDKRYHLAPGDINVGDEIITANKAKIKTGNRMMLKNIPLGYSIYNIELTPNKGGQTAKSAG